MQILKMIFILRLSSNNYDDSENIWHNISNSFRLWPRLLLLLTGLVCLSNSFAQISVPNIQQGAPGTLLSGPVDPDMGRLAVIQVLGGYVITIPETPGSDQNDHHMTKAWDISDPSNPKAIQPINPNENGGYFGETGDPILAHGSFSRGNEVYIDGNENNSNDGEASWNTFDTIRLNDDGSLEHVRWSGPAEPELIYPNGRPVKSKSGDREYAAWYTKGSMMRPWSLDDNWAYNENASNVTRLTLDNVLMAEWDIVAETGVSGFGNFLGNLLIYASDQRNTGVAIYDASDINVDPSTGERKPRLLDVFNIPQAEGGVGGYWSEISGHYLIFARQKDSTNPNSFAGIQVVDFSDPTDLKLNCQAELKNPGQEKHWMLDTDPMYVGLQDEYAFVDNFKVDIRTCEVVLRLDISNGQRGSECYSGYQDCPKRIINTSQYARIVGNLWLTGGYPTRKNIDGLGIWVHQSEPDNRAPYIAYHVPEPDQTSYPINAPLGFSIPETLKTTTIVTSETKRTGQVESITLKEAGGDPVRIDYVLSHQGILTVSPVKGLKPDTEYEVVFTAGIEDAVGNKMHPYRFRFSTGDSVDSKGIRKKSKQLIIKKIELSPGDVIQAGQSVTVNVESEKADEYLISIENEAGNWQMSNSRSMNFSDSGTYFVNVRARNFESESALLRIQIDVMSGQGRQRPGTSSSQLACDIGSDEVWVVNPDNDSVAVLNAETLTKQQELHGLNNPQGIAAIGNDEVWVTSQNDDQIHIFDVKTKQLKRTIETGYGSAPSQIMSSRDGKSVYVTIYNAGAVVRYSASGKKIMGAPIYLAPTVKSMALTPDGSRLFVARLISPAHWAEVYEIDVASWKLNRVYRLEKHLINDAIDEGRGKPNYLTDIAVNGEGNRAYIVGKKDNIDRGPLNGLDMALDDDNTVRTIGMTLDLDKGIELKDQRVDFDNTSSLSALAMSDDSRYLFVAQQGKNTVQAMEIDSDYRFTGLTHSYRVGLAPQGLCFDTSQGTLFVKNFTDRSVTSLDLSSVHASPAKTTIPTVADEKLSANILSGQKIFYNAFNGLTDSAPVGKMSAEGYLSCVSCHIDGGHDGNTYDQSARGEGLRNNVSLQGRSGTRFGNVHWSANFDEVHDFENDIRSSFKGTGFLSASQFASSRDPLGKEKAGMSQELDDLAAYVGSLGKAALPRSPHRKSSGKLTASGIAGRKVFHDIGCADCHSGKAFTDTKVHDVGTLRPSSGQRRGAPLEGLKTPSLLGVFLTPPYLHDGSANSLAAIFDTVGGQTWQTDEGADMLRRNGTFIRHVEYSYLRNAGGARLIGDEARLVVFDNFSRGVDGAGKLRVRYGSSISGGKLEVYINNRKQGDLVLETLPLVEGEDALFVESSSLTVQLPGDPYTISLVYRGSGSLVVDEFTVANADDVDRAGVHLVAAALSVRQRKNLISYLEQIDRASAPDDDEMDIFANQRVESRSVEGGNSSADKR